MLLYTAAPANNNVEIMNWPEIKTHMPVMNNNPIKIFFLSKAFIVTSIGNEKIKGDKLLRCLIYSSIRHAKISAFHKYFILLFITDSYIYFEL